MFWTLFKKFEPVSKVLAPLVSQAGYGPGGFAYGRGLFTSYQQ